MKLALLRNKTQLQNIYSYKVDRIYKSVFFNKIFQKIFNEIKK